MEKPAELSAAGVPENHRAGRVRPIQGLARWLFRRAGWRISGNIPDANRVLLVVGPHTSNWDFVIATLAMLALDIRLHFLAKHSLFFPPLGYVLRALGGIAIDRSRPEGFVSSTADAIKGSEELILAITPEGTRSPVAKLKTGFSRIAAEVPCAYVPVLLDFGKRTIQLAEPRTAVDPEADAAAMHRLFATVTPRRASNFLPPEQC